jgi:hypothetical protein
MPRGWRKGSGGVICNFFQDLILVTFGLQAIVIVNHALHLGLGTESSFLFTLRRTMYIFWYPHSVHYICDPPHETFALLFSFHVSGFTAAK